LEGEAIPDANTFRRILEKHPEELQKAIETISNDRSLDRKEMLQNLSSNLSSLELLVLLKNHDLIWTNIKSKILSYSRNQHYLQLQPTFLSYCQSSHISINN
jgi:hypothetical protein